MRLAGIEGAHRRRRGKPRRKASTTTAPDLVQRQFTATAPNRLWVADLPSAHREGFFYLAVVVDAYSPPRRRLGNGRPPTHRVDPRRRRHGYPAPPTGPGPAHPSPLKTELVYTRAWPSRDELELEVFSYIKGFYTPRRRHRRLGNVSPDIYEKIHRESLTDIEVSGR